MKTILILTVYFLVYCQWTIAGSYDRKLFHHWIDVDHDCQDTRAEILIQTSLVPVTFGGKKNCTVKSGQWVDPYTSAVITKASDLDIDHVIPLKWAYDHGADKWRPDQREKFANDPENILPVSKKFNRQKGAKGPEEWMPPNPKYRCVYLHKWKQIADLYLLTGMTRSIAGLEDCAVVSP